MDSGTMAVLTGLLGTAIGAVLIGGALLAAYLVGKERGRRERDEREDQSLIANSARLRQLEESHERLLVELELMRGVGPGARDPRRREIEASERRTPH